MWSASSARRGTQACWAGGCVRDQLMGTQPKDYDVATDAAPERVREIFGRRRTLALGAAFGVITVLGPKGAGQIEVATFRQDAAYSDGRHPDAVTFTDAEHDAQRRDFTINGLFFDPLAEQVIDYVGGQDDLQQRVDPGDRRSAGPDRRGQAADAAGRAVRRPLRLRPRRADAGRDPAAGPRAGDRQRRARRRRIAADTDQRQPRAGPGAARGFGPARGCAARERAAPPKPRPVVAVCRLSSVRSTAPRSRCRSRSCCASCNLTSRSRSAPDRLRALEADERRAGRRA